MIAKNGKPDEMEQGVMGIFPEMENLMSAVKILQTESFKIDTIFSPVASHEFQKTLGLKPSPVRCYTLVGGILGVISGLGLASYAHLEWKLITSGKPVIAWLPFFIIAFEGCILGGVLATMLGMMIHSRLFHFRLPQVYHPRFSQDRFGIFVPCNEIEYDQVSKILKGSGAEEIHAVRE
jgi:hypothetical protein